MVMFRGWKHPEIWFDKRHGVPGRLKRRLEVGLDTGRLQMPFY